ncbi:hypothetical protein [Bradyrhizobium sp. P5_C12]
MTSELESRWIDAGACALVTIAIFAIVYSVNGGAAFPADDAFINLHNAQVLRLGRDENYEGVPALVGATSGVHLALLLAFEQLVYPDTAALYVLSSLSGVAYVLGVFFMCLNIGCPRLEAALIALGSLVFAGTLFQVLNGMDTGLAMAAVAWDIKLLTDKRRTFWLPALCGIMPFVRPELSFLSAASMLIVFWEKYAATGFKIAAAAVAALSSVPFLLWYWIDTGSLMPNTVSAKMYFFAERYADWSDKSLLMLLAVSQAAFLSFPLFLCLRFARPAAVGRMLALFVAVFLGAYFWRFPGGLQHNGGRYLYVLAPIVLFGVACGLSSAFRKQTLSMVAISILFLPLGFVLQLKDYRTHIVGFQENLADVVRWMNANLPDRPMVMVHDAGYVAYAGHAALVDLVGLKTPAAMDFHRRATYPSVGLQRSRAVAEIAETFQPQYLLVIQDWDEKFRFVEGLRGEGWTAREVYAGHAPPETPAALIYHLYELNRPHRALVSPGS